MTQPSRRRARRAPVGIPIRFDHGRPLSTSPTGAGSWRRIESSDCRPVPRAAPWAGRWQAHVMDGLRKHGDVRLDQAQPSTLRSMSLDECPSTNRMWMPIASPGSSRSKVRSARSWQLVERPGVLAPAARARRPSPPRRPSGLSTTSRSARQSRRVVLVGPNPARRPSRSPAGEPVAADQLRVARLAVSAAVVVARVARLRRVASCRVASARCRRQRRRCRCTRPRPPADGEQGAG